MLSAYVRATRCPVLTYRMLPPGFSGGRGRASSGERIRQVPKLRPPSFLFHSTSVVGRPNLGKHGAQARRCGFSRLEGT
eukprot:3413118-Rhodomonas_salina.1